MQRRKSSARRSQALLQLPRTQGTREAQGDVNKLPSVMGGPGTGRRCPCRDSQDLTPRGAGTSSALAGASQHWHQAGEGQANSAGIRAARLKTRGCAALTPLSDLAVHGLKGSPLLQGSGLGQDPAPAPV